MRLSTLARVILPAAALSASPALAQTGETVAERTWWLPANYATFGGTVDHLFYFILYLTGIVCVGVFAAMIYFLVKYRHRPGRHARFTHGNTRLELVWTLVPTVILAMTAVVSQASWSRMKMGRAQPGGPPPIEVEVVAQQFLWNFRYPGPDGVFGERRAELMTASGDAASQIGLDRSGAGADDLVLPTLTVPVNREVRARLTSKDVLHSFFLPNFRVKQDAVPGLMGTVWFEPTITSAEGVGTDASGKPQPFDIVCAELCGQGHFKMSGQMFVVTQDEFDSFLQREYEAMAPAEDEEEGYY